jgi:hypothetical protein
VKNSPNFKKESKNDKDKYLITQFGLGVIIWYFFNRSYKETINYPDQYLYWLILIVFTITLVFRFKRIKTEFLKQREYFLGKMVSLGINVVFTAIVAWLIAGIILIPFNYYNIYKSQANDSQTMKCEIEKVNTKGKSYLYFKVDNKTNLINGYIRNMKDINNSNANKYWLILKTRPGLLGTYIVENWDIEHK